jgi:hypothetical protein
MSVSIYQLSICNLIEGQEIEREGKERNDQNMFYALNIEFRASFFFLLKICFG